MQHDGKVKPGLGRPCVRDTRSGNLIKHAHPEHHSDDRLQPHKSTEQRLALNKENDVQDHTKHKMWWKSMYKVVAFICLTICSQPVSFLHAATIEEIVANLEECHPALRKAQTDVARGNSGVEATKANRLPSFSVNSSGFMGASGTTTAANASIKMPLATFGKQKSSEKIAQLEAAVEEARYNEIVSNHILSFFTLHAELESLKRQRDVFNNLALDQEELLKSVQRRADQGLSPLSDVDNARSKLNRNISERNSREFRIQEITAEIKLLSCSQRALRFSISDILQLSARRSANLETLNPAILLAKAELNLVAARLEYQTLAARPTLNLEAESPISADANEQARVGLSIAYEYGNAGKAQRVATTQRQQELAGASYSMDASISKIATEQTTLQQFISEYRGKIIPTEKENVTILNRSLASKTRLFDSGRISLFELLSAYDEVASAEIAVEQYNQSMIEAQLKMAKNVGAFSPNSE